MRTYFLLGDTFYVLGVTLMAALLASVLRKKPEHLDAGGAH